MALDSSVTVFDYVWEYAGDESEDSLPKRVRVRSIASVCGDFEQPIKGAYFALNTFLLYSYYQCSECVFLFTRLHGVKQWLDYCLIPSCIHEPPVNVGEERVGYNHSQGDDEYQTCVARWYLPALILPFFLFGLEWY